MVGGEIRNGQEVAQRRVVDQNIHRAERRPRAVHQGLAIAFGGDIRREGAGLAAGLGNGLNRAGKGAFQVVVAFVQGPRRTGDRGPFGRELFRDDLADAPAGPGHNGCLAVQFTHDCVLLEFSSDAFSRTHANLSNRTVGQCRANVASLAKQN